MNLVNEKDSCCINQPTNQSINQPTNQPINQSTNQSINVCHATLRIAQRYTTARCLFLSRSFVYCVETAQQNIIVIFTFL